LNRASPAVIPVLNKGKAKGKGKGKGTAFRRQPRPNAPAVSSLG